MGVVGRPGWFWLLQVVKVTDVQFGFLKLDFDQVEVALIAVSTSTTRQLLGENVV